MSQVSDVLAGQRAPTTSRHQLVTSRHRLSTYGRRAFSVAGRSVWDPPIPLQLRDPYISIGCFQTFVQDMAVLEVLPCFLTQCAIHKSTIYITLHTLPKSASWDELIVSL